MHLRPSLLACLATWVVMLSFSDVALADETFDRAAASASLQTVDLAKCKATNAKRGDGHVVVTFTTNGSVSQATVDRGPMVGTPTAKCIAKAFTTQAKVPAFGGGAVQVGKNFKFE